MTLTEKFVVWMNAVVLVAMIVFCCVASSLFIRIVNLEHRIDVFLECEKTSEENGAMIRGLLGDYWVMELKPYGEEDIRIEARLDPTTEPIK